jgi:hypothetical protein
VQQPLSSKVSGPLRPSAYAIFWMYRSMLVMALGCRPIVLYTQDQHLFLPSRTWSGSFGHLRLWKHILDPEREHDLAYDSKAPTCGYQKMVRAGVVMLWEQCAKATPSRVPAALQCSTFHLPKQSSSGFLGESFFRSTRADTQDALQLPTFILRYSCNRLSLSCTPSVCPESLER